MKKFLHRRPSASMVVAMTALVVASSGTAIAAGLVSGNKLIKKNSLSGNRLVKHSVTGTQINLKKLGKVPSAKTADSAKTATSATTAKTATTATSATSALNATNAVNATNATNAVTAASSLSTNAVKTWYQTAAVGQTVTLLTVGPFTYTGECTTGPEAETYVQTSQTDSVSDSYEDDNVVPFDPSTGPTEIGYTANGTSGPAWIGPNDGSDAQFSGDGKTYVNTFTSEGAAFGSFPSGCLFVGTALVVTH